MEPTAPIYTSLLICERVLVENDNVNSAIRLADLFRVVFDPDVPPEKRPINMSIIFMARFPADDTSIHAIQIRLERPNGELVLVGGTEPSQIPSPLNGSLRGISMSARFGVIPFLMGLHYIIVELDGMQVSKAPFTLRQIEVSAPEEAG